MTRQIHIYHVNKNDYEDQKWVNDRQVLAAWQWVTLRKNKKINLLAYHEITFRVKLVSKQHAVQKYTNYRCFYQHIELEKNLFNANKAERKYQNGAKLLQEPAKFHIWFICTYNMTYALVKLEKHACYACASFTNWMRNS